MPSYFIDKELGEKHKIGTVYKGNIKIGQIHKGNTLVYQSAFRITYVIDENREYVEKVVPKKTILSPSTFTPAKEGWTFVGWRYDTIASSSILTDEISTKHITLYAVFKQTVKRLFRSNGTQTALGTRYYNNGNISNATITVPNGVGISGWNWRGWSAAEDTRADAAVAYSNGAKISNVESEANHYGLYYRNVSITCYWKCAYCGAVVYSYNSYPDDCPNGQCGSGTAGTSWHGAGSESYTEWYSGSGASKKS